METKKELKEIQKELQKEGRITIITNNLYGHPQLWDITNSNGILLNVKKKENNEA